LKESGIVAFFACHEIKEQASLFPTSLISSSPGEARIMTDCPVYSTLLVKSLCPLVFFYSYRVFDYESDKPPSTIPSTAAGGTP